MIKTKITNYFKSFFILFFICFYVLASKAQTKLDLNTSIKLATESSLAAFKAKNLYLSGYWEYHTYVSQKRPQLILNTIPLDYNRALTKRYNSVLDIDEYKEQQNIYSWANASITQNLPLTGGAFYIDSELGYLKNYGENAYTQFSSVPIRIGYNQKLFGFNIFKWKRKIEPIKYEKAQKELIKDIETISIQLVDNYFLLLLAQKQLEIAQINKANADTLYNIGKNRLAIASLSQSDVLSLKVDVLNAENSLALADKNLKKYQYSFASFLRMPENSLVELSIPDELTDLQIEYNQAMDLAEKNNPELLDYKQQQLEAAMNLEQIKRENRFNASLNASYGFNQQNSVLIKSYQNPLDQQKVMIGLSIPILDWGQNKGKYNMAKRNLDVVNATTEQAAIDFRQNVMIAVTDFNMQYKIVMNALETRDVAKQAYETTKQRFLIGKVDVTTLSLVLQRQDNANINYLNALYSYWKYYYTIRELTLYDFEKKMPLTQDYDKMLDVD
jgi:outer membrane protein TolC